MATGYRVFRRGSGQFLYEWGYAANDVDGSPTGMTAGQSGDIAEIGHLPDKTVQATGTIGTVTTIDFRGGNIKNAANLTNLKDLGGTAINLVPLNGNAGVRENPGFFSPVIGSGSGATIIVRAYCRRGRVT